MSLPSQPSLSHDFDFTDPDLLATRLPVEEWAQLRRTAPVWWVDQPDGVSGFDDGGYWVVSKLEHIKEISKAPQIWSNSANTAVIRFNGDISRDEIDIQRARQILEAIRKRLGNALSPELERDYLERLLQMR